MTIYICIGKSECCQTLRFSSLEIGDHQNTMGVYHYYDMDEEGFGLYYNHQMRTFLSRDNELMFWIVS